MLAIGAVIGAGIFGAIGTAAAGQYDAAGHLVRSGAGPALVVSFLFLGVACALAGLCYAELAAMIPQAGSAYAYSYATLGELVAWIIGWDLILEYAVGNVAVAISWADYFTSLLRSFDVQLPVWLTTGYRTALLSPDPAVHGLLQTAPHVAGIPILINVPAFLIVGAITWLLLLGVRESATVNNIMVTIKLLVLGLFIVAGLSHLNPANYHPFAPNGFRGVHQGAAIVFFAYIGFDAISTAAEETKNPQRSLPIGILGGLAICTVIYMIVGAVLTGMVPYTELGVADPLAKALNSAGFTTVGWIVALGAIISMSAVLLVFQYGQPRIVFAMGRDGLLPPWAAKVHAKTRVPHITRRPSQRREAPHQDRAGSRARRRRRRGREHARTGGGMGALDRRQRRRTGGAGVPPHAAHDRDSARLHLDHAGRRGNRRHPQGRARWDPDDRVLPALHGAVGRDRARPRQRLPARRRPRARRARAADDDVPRAGAGAASRRLDAVRHRDVRQHGAAQPDPGGGGDGLVGHHLLLARLRRRAHADPGREGAAVAPGTRRRRRSGREDHRPRDEARPLRRVRAHFLYHLAVRVGAAAAAGAVCRHRAGRLGDPRECKPVDPRPGVRRARGTGALEPYPGEHHHRLLNQFEQRHPPHQHRRRRGRAEDPAHDRRLRAAPGLDDVHERHGSLRRRDRAVPRAGIRRVARPREPDRRARAERHYRGGRRRRAWLLD